jgi:hypothetical protein
MSDEEFRRRLATRDLTSPGITLDDAVRRAAGRPPSRRPSWTPRLAAAAIVVWVAVFAVQAAVERNLNGLAPPSQSLVAHEAAPSLLVEQKLLLAELLGEQIVAPAMAEPSGAKGPPARRESGDHRRSGSAPTRRWTRV